MRTSALLLVVALLAGPASATFDVQKLTDTASSKLHNWTATVTSAVHQLTQNAENNLHEIANNIDLDKLKQLDFLQLVPRVHDRIQHKKQIILNKKQVIRNKKKALKETLFNKKQEKVIAIKGLKQNLASAFEEYPWPVVRRKIVYIYE